MTNLIDSIVNKDYVMAESVITETVGLIMEKKLLEIKKKIAAKMCEMKLDSFKPDYDDIEDRRKEKAVNSSIKTNFGGKQEVNKAGKGDLQVTTVTKTVKEDQEQLDEARIRMIKVRIRGGKIQRRKKVSNVPGMTLRGGKLKRMSTAERRRRKMGARKAVRKRAPKMGRTLMKRNRSIRKRKAMGL